MKQALSLGFGSALLAASLCALGDSLFLADEIPVGVLSGACFYGAVAIYWLWGDLSGGYSGKPAGGGSGQTKTPPKRGQAWLVNLGRHALPGPRPYACDSLPQLPRPDHPNMAVLKSKLAKCVYRPDEQIYPTGASSRAPLKEEAAPQRGR